MVKSYTRYLVWPYNEYLFIFWLNYERVSDYSEYFLVGLRGGLPVFETILKGGYVVDPVSGYVGFYDVGLKNGRVAEISPFIIPTRSTESIDMQGYYILPGIVDMHVHASEWLGGQYGHKMLALAGVTTALDMSGPIDGVLKMAKNYGAGLNIASIEYVRPGHTVADANPSNESLEDLLHKSMSKGSLGFKLLGGHYPLTPEATARAIQVANANQAYIAFHAGSLATGSTIEGMLEAVALSQGLSLHLAHVNSYCRGSVRPHMIETEEAVSALLANPNIRSESYLAVVNGTSAKCSQGTPESKVTERCLITGGFAATEQGLEEAIMAGWAQINMEAGGKVILAVGDEARAYWREKNTDTTVSFKVNPAEPRVRLATAKRPNGTFVVDAISTDGGGIPRNVIVEMGLSLVKLEALTIEEFVQKTSYNPAQILGLKNKGHLSIGADADITVVDYARQSPVMTMVGGKVAMYKGLVCGQGSNIITTQAGASYVRSQGLNPVVVDLSESGFYQKR